MNKDTKFLIDTIKEASKLIDDDFKVKAKGTKGDLVTNFDYKVEQFLIEKIKKNYPSFDIVSEETNSLKTLSDNCFVFDPIDGTVNFAHGIPLWGIQMAMIKDKKVCASCIYLPEFDECYYADKTGAFKNGKKISVKQQDFKSEVFIIDGTARIPTIVRVGKQVRNYRNIGASCVSYAWLASGRVAGVIYKMDNLWDYVPGQFLVEMAGGVVQDKKMAHVSACGKKEANFLSKVGKYFEDDMAFTNHD